MTLQRAVRRTARGELLARPLRRGAGRLALVVVRWCVPGCRRVLTLGTLIRWARRPAAQAGQASYTHSSVRVVAFLVAVAAEAFLVAVAVLLAQVGASTRALKLQALGAPWQTAA